MANTNFAFRPEGTAALAVSTTSASVLLDGGPAFAVRIVNTGSVTAFVRFGATTPTAVATDMPLLSGMTEVFTVPVGALYIAAITSASTTTLAITSGGGL